MFTIILDCAVILTLLITIFLCFTVKKKIDTVRNSKNEMKDLIVDFDKSITTAYEAINTAHERIKSLTATNTEISNEIKNNLREVDQLADDLTYMRKSNYTLLEDMQTLINQVNEIKESEIYNKITLLLQQIEQMKVECLTIENILKSFNDIHQSERLIQLKNIIDQFNKIKRSKSLSKLSTK